MRHELMNQFLEPLEKPMVTKVNNIEFTIMKMILCDDIYTYSELIQKTNRTKSWVMNRFRKAANRLGIEPNIQSVRSEYIRFLEFEIEILKEELKEKSRDCSRPR